MFDWVLLTSLNISERSFKLLLTLFSPIFPLDSPENIKNQRFSDVFKEIKREHLEEKG